MVYAIRNSEMATHGRCLRLWGWSGALRGNLRPKQQRSGALWQGTGGHFALEDFHGLRRYGSDPAVAFDAYVDAFLPGELPAEAGDLADTIRFSLRYYANHWLTRRNEYSTVWRDGRPLVELRWELPVPGSDQLATGTFDRIVTDPRGRVYVMDYKFYREVQSEKLANDRQVSTYLWAARQLFERVDGLIHLQFRKAKCSGPEVLKSGEYSQARSAPVTYEMYRAALLETFGEVPERYRAHLNWLAEQDSVDGDMLIRRFLVRRSPEFLAMHEYSLAAQMNDMARAEQVLYPNPTKECTWCDFYQVCLALDMGADYEGLLESSFTSREEDEAWKGRVRWPA